MFDATQLEAPSGKSPQDENFPVVTRLVPARLRPHIATFYAYARAIDDIADNADLPPGEKIRRLDEFAKAVSGISAGNPGPGKALEIRRSLLAMRLTDRHCIDLTRAFKQDVTKRRYRDWDDLMGYCDLSAAPVGRYLVDLHGESAAAYPNSDALCSALQVLNHLQDCKDDFRSLDRVYLPQDWMAQSGVAVDALNRRRCTQPLRRVFDLCLDATDGLLALASRLPGKLRDPRFAMDAAVIIDIAKMLSAELRRRDPLAERVVLTKVQYAACCAYGIGRVLFRRVWRRDRDGIALQRR